MTELAGQTAVVTGSSSGIGRAVALELAAAGADVMIHARQSHAAAEAVAGEVRCMGGEAEVNLAILRGHEAHEKLVERAWQWRGQVDIWMNNAGVDTLTGDMARATFEEKLDELWRV